MSEESDGQQAGSQGEQQQSEFKPITSQEEFEKALGKRLERERAKFADYDDLRSKASKLDEIEEKNKTELQKAMERAEAAEKRAAENERVALRTRIAAEMNVPVEVLNGDNEETVRASAQKILDWRDSNKKAAPEPKKLKSGSSAGDQDRGSRAAQALRTLRNQ